MACKIVVRVETMTEPFPSWLLVMFGGSFVIMGTALVAVLVEGFLNFPDPPIYFIAVAATAQTINLISIIIAAKMLRMRKKRDG